MFSLVFYTNSHSYWCENFNALGCAIQYRRKCCFASLVSCSLILLKVIVHLLPVLIGSRHTSYLSSTICDEFISIMSKRILNKIISEIKSAGHFSISVDSTHDVSNVDQLTCVIRCVLPCCPVERFVHFLPMMQHTGLELATRLLMFLDLHGLYIKKFRGQSYDNASNMSGRYNGMQAIILEKCQFAAFVSCVAHSLNLVGKCAAECCLMSSASSTS